MDFKNWNISTKIGLVFLLFLVLALINFTTVYYYKSYSQRGYDVLMRSVAENPNIVEKIRIINTSFVYKGDTSQVSNLKSLIEQHGQNLDLVQFGGVTSYLGETVRCEALSPNFEVAVHNLQAYWKEYAFHLERLIANQQFLISIGQYRKWNKQLNGLLKENSMPGEVHIALYHMQVKIDAFLEGDLSLKEDILKELAIVELYVKNLKNRDASKLKLIWSNLGFHVRFLANRIKQIESLHYIESNSIYIANLDIHFSNIFAEDVIKKKVSANANLIFIMVLVVFLNMVLVLFGLRIIKQFVVLPIQSIGYTAMEFYNGNENIEFEVFHKDEIGSLVIQFNRMLQKLKSLNSETNMLNIQPEVVKTHLLLDKVTALFGPKAESIGVELSAFYAENIPDFVRIDEAKVIQVLSNLVGNALKNTKMGSVKITLDMIPMSEDLQKYIFTVKDTGVGIAQYRIDSFLNDDTPIHKRKECVHLNIGSGLAICKKLAEKMGDGMEVESQLNQGSSFRFSVISTAVLDHEIQKIKKEFK